MKYIYQELENLELDDPHEHTKLEFDQSRLSNLLRLKEGVKAILLRLDESLNEYPTILEHTNFCIPPVECDRKKRSLHSVHPKLQQESMAKSFLVPL